MNVSRQRILPFIRILALLCSALYALGTATHGYAGDPPGATQNSNDSATGSNANTPVKNSAPVARDDPLAAATHKNTRVVTKNVLDNDTLPEHAAIRAFDARSANGGKVTHNGDGRFTFTPAAGFVGTDTFSYSLGGKKTGTTTATVTVTVSALPRGFLDVTLLPGVDPSGVADSTQGLQSAVELARDFGLSAFFPSGTYRVSDTLDLAQNTKRVSRRKPRGRLEGGIRTQACVLIGSSLGARPRIVLDDGSAGFDNPDRPKAVLYYRLNYQTANQAQEVVPNTFKNNGATTQFGQGLRNIDIVTGKNPGAIGLHMAAAQRSFLEDVRIDASGALAGVSGIPGRGMATVNVEISGGRFGFWLQRGSLGASLVGVVLRNQTENAIVWRSAVGLSVTGFRIEKSAGTGAAITTQGGKYRSGNLMLAHGIIETKKSGPALDNGAGNYVYMKNVWVSGGADIIKSANKPTVAAADGDWTRVEEYSHTRSTGKLPHVNLIDGQSHRKDLITTSASKGPPPDLMSRHVWRALPSFEDPGVVSALDAGAKGDGLSDDTDALQRAIDSHHQVFLPKGNYRISRPLRLHADTRLFGVPGVGGSVISRATGWNPGQPGWMIETDDEPESSAYLGELTLEQEQNAFLGGVRWRLGAASMLHNVGVRRMNESENVQVFRVTGNGGGRWYRFEYSAKKSRKAKANPGFRSLLVDGTRQPLFVYGFNPEHGQNEPFIEIRGSQNVFFLGGKTEIHPGHFMLIRDARNVWINQLGRHSLGAGKSTFIVDKGSNVQITGVWPNEKKSASKSKPRYSVLERDTGLSIDGDASIGVYRRGTVNALRIPATIASGPAGARVAVGDTATFSVAALGEPPLNYQWQKNGRVIPGATGDRYTTPAITASDDGAAFTVTVSNALDSVTSTPAKLATAPE